MSIEFCPGIAKTIDCSVTNNFVYIIDAFYGVSDENPAVCLYLYNNTLFIKIFDLKRLKN